MISDTRLEKELLELERKRLKLMKVKDETNAVAILKYQGARVPADVRKQIQVIQEIVCRHYNLKMPQILSRSRFEDITRPRQIIFYLARKITPSGSSAVGRMYGKIHGTVLYGAQRIEDMMTVDQELKTRVEELERQCVEALGKINEP